MKKVLALSLAVVLALSMFAFIPASAAVKNLLPGTTTAIKGFVDGAWLGGIIDSDPDSQGQLMMGVWTKDTKAVDNPHLAANRISWDTSTKKVTNRSLKIVNEIQTNSTGAIYVRGLKRNTKYVLQGWVKTDISGEGYAHLRLELKSTVLDASKELYYNAIGDALQSEGIEGKKDWTRVSIKFTTPSNQDCFVTFYPELGNAKGTCWFDGLAIVEGTSVVDDSQIEGLGAAAPVPAREIKVFYQDKEIPFGGTKPVIENGSTLVPLRAIFEALGATVDYANGNITAKKGDTIVKLTVGSKNATVSGKAVTLAVPAKVVNGSTLVPLQIGRAHV